MVSVRVSRLAADDRGGIVEKAHLCQAGAPVCGHERQCGEPLGLHKAEVEVDDQEDRIQKELCNQPDQDDEWFPRIENPPTQ